MKKFTLFFSALLFSMMSFAGVVTFDADADKGNAGTDSNNATAYTITKSGVTVEVSSGILGTYNNETHYRVYKNQTLTITSTVGNITSVEFTCTANDDAKYGPGCFTWSVGDYTYSGAVGTWTGNAAEIVFTASSNQVRATQVVVTIDGEVVPDDGGNSDDNGGNDNGGTTPPANPEGVITCAQAVEICQTTGETSTTETYTIRGYVTEMKESYNSQFGNATYWMADEKGGGQVLQAYRVKPVNAADQAVKVNDYVEVVGTLVNFKGNTPEVNAGGTYTIITSADGGTTPPTPPTPPTDLVGEGTVENPYTVEDVLALNNTSKGPHYVKGFIIGQVNGASIQSGLDTEAPFVGSTNSDGSVATQGTNLMIAGVVGETTNIVAVQLPKGELRDAFNLVENPDVLGKEVLICGNLEKYFGVPGIKSPTSIEVIGGGNDDVVNVKDLQYADAYYHEYEGVAYYDIDLYNDIDPDTYEYVYPELYIITEAKSKTALNGTYDLLYAGYWTSANDSVEIGETMGTVTIKNVDEESNYSFVGSFVGADGKTYKFNQVVNVYAYDVDADYAEIELSEEATETPAGDIVFDADVDQGDASLDSNNRAPYTISKDGITMDVTEGIIGVYNNECHYRIYKNQTLTLTSTVGNIVKVEFTCTANDDAQYGPGCFIVDGGEYAYSGAVGTWTGAADAITFTASTNQVRASQVVVTIASTGTGVEDVVTVEVPVKVIENGQLMIIRGENVYNVLGAQVK